MKRLTVLFLFLIFSFAAPAQEIDKIPSITVSGTGEVQIAPDEVEFSLDATNTNKDLQTAKRLNDETVAKIIELTHRFSVLPQNVQTAHISVEMKYESVREAKTRVFNEEGDEIGKRIFKGYEVSKTVTVKLTDITRFEEFFAEVLKTGITEVYKVEFSTSKLRETRDKAREMAIKAAKEKAEAMANAVGQTIGKAIKISEGTLGTQSPPYYAATSNSMAVSGSFSEKLATFAPGAIKVEAQVIVSFQLN